MLHVADEGLVRLEPTSPSLPTAIYAATEGLRIVDLDDDRVVFEPLSWDAHLLNPAAAAVLDLFLQGPQSVDAVVAFLADALDPSERPSAQEHARRLVAELQALGLLQPVRESADARF